ncbi:MAG: hypothetical protein AABY07_10785 [Nanoarchaeota archaeon]
MRLGLRIDPNFTLRYKNLESISRHIVIAAKKMGTIQTTRTKFDPKVLTIDAIDFPLKNKLGIKNVKKYMDLLLRREKGIKFLVGDRITGARERNLNIKDIATIIKLPNKTKFNERIVTNFKASNKIHLIQKVRKFHKLDDESSIFKHHLVRYDPKNFYKWGSPSNPSFNIEIKSEIQLPKKDIYIDDIKASIKSLKFGNKNVNKVLNLMIRREPKINTISGVRVTGIARNRGNRVVNINIPKNKLIRKSKKKI